MKKVLLYICLGILTFSMTACNAAKETKEVMSETSVESSVSEKNEEDVTQTEASEEEEIKASEESKPETTEKEETKKEYSACASKNRKLYYFTENTKRVSNK